VLPNLFMTVAWYGHLRFENKPLVTVVLASWGIAFFEYCLQVPANRWGHAVYSAPQPQGHAGSDHAGGVRGFLDLVPGRAAEVEPLGRASR
jgi:hypothetical protein